MNKIRDVHHALELLDKHRKNVEDFYNDPMTEAMGVPTGDFQRDFDTKERGILSYLIENADGGVRETALQDMERKNLTVGIDWGNIPSVKHKARVIQGGVRCWRFKK